MKSIANIYIILIGLLGIDIGVTIFGLVKEIKKRKHAKKGSDKK